jgi:hypothetical protein
MQRYVRDDVQPWEFCPHGVKPSTPPPHALLLDSRRVRSSVFGGYRGHSNCGPLEGGDREEEADCVC